MVSLLGALLGFLSAMVPEGLRMLRERGERAHALALIDRRAVDDARYPPRSTTLPPACGGRLAALVRPVLALGFFVLYAYVKISTKSGWDDEDRALFAGVVSFYFGQRTFVKGRG